MTDAPKLSDTLARVRDAGAVGHADALEASLLGIEKDCPVQQDGLTCWGDTPACYTETDTESGVCVCALPRRQGGLLQRLEAASAPDVIGHDERIEGAYAVLEALRTELGEVPKDG